MAGAQVEFNYQTWILRYPEFADTVPQELAEIYFAEATLYHANDGSGPVVDGAQQLLLLGMLVAHIAQINAGSAGNAASPVAGVLTSASEGSVSVGIQPFSAPGSEMWFVTTKYGIQYWAATAQYRTMRYVAAKPRVFNPPVY